MYDVAAINYSLALGTVLLQVATIVLIALFALRKNPDLAGIAALVSRWGLWAGFAVALAAVGITLFYSEVLGFAACFWCWIGRIFLYPQAILLGLAAWRKDSSIALYSIALSISGALVGLYQHYLQMGGGSLLPCPAIPGTDCAARFLFEFGYITFPLMGFSLFAFLIVLMLFVRSSRP